MDHIAETAYATVTYSTGDVVLATTDLHGATNIDVQALDSTALGAPTTWGTPPTGNIVIGGNVELFAGNTALVADGSSNLKVNIAAGSVTAVISGSVTVGNFPAIQPVSFAGSVTVGNFPATQPVSGTITALQGTSPWVVSGSVTALPSGIQPISGSVTALMETVTSAPTDVNLTFNPFRGDAAGNLRVNPFGNTGSFITTVVSATGSNPTYTVPAGYKLLLKSLGLGLTTSSTAGTRGIEVTIVTAAGAGIWVGAAFSAAASIAANLFSTPVPILVTTPGAISNGTQNWTPMPPELTLGPGTVISYNISSIQAADTFKLTVCGMLLPD
jgi:hypothetical protein